MERNLEIVDAVEKEKVFIDKGKKNREKFIENIERHFPFLLKPILKLERNYFMSYINETWAFLIDCDRSFIEALNQNYVALKEHLYTLETKDLKVLCIKLEGMEASVDDKVTIPCVSLSYKDSDLYHSGFKFKHRNYEWINIFAPNNILIKRLYRQKIIRYEMRLNDLVKNSSEKNRALFLFFKYLFEENKETSLMLKDVINDMERSVFAINAPISISLLFDTFNKKMLFETKYANKDFGKATNKLSMYENYVRHFLSRKLNENEFKAIENSIGTILNGNAELAQRAFTRNFVKAFLNEYIKIRIFGNSAISDEEYGILKDYFRLRENLNEEYNLNMKSFRRLKEEHDRLIHLQNSLNSENREIKFKRNNPFVKFRCPKGMRFLATAKEIADEGRIQRNCVATYISSVASGNCGIYSLTINKKRYTIRLRMNNKRYYLDEIRGFANVSAEDEVVDYVEKAIEENNFY